MSMCLMLWHYVPLSNWLNIVYTLAGCFLGLGAVELHHLLACALAITAIAGKPPCLVAVPTHFYKVVLSESKSRLPFGAPKVSVGAFVMPNAQIQPDMPLTAFAVPLEMLEDVAGASTARTVTHETVICQLRPLSIDACLA